MGMERISAFRWLTSRSDIEARRFLNVDMLIRTFRNPCPDDGEIFLLIGPGRMSINERRLAGFQIAIAD